MRKTIFISMLSSAILMLAACGSAGSDKDVKSFSIQDTNGAEIGTLTIKSLGTGGVDLEVRVSGLEPGTRAMHFHEFGKCDGPDFKTAGGHFNPKGVPHGEHAGDMMNVVVDAEGNGVFNVLNSKVTLSGPDLPALMDTDGSALIIHGGADDYTSQPSGAAGPRVACSVIPGR
jgi:Cu-Zn family superoxide dismutase